MGDRITLATKAFCKVRDSIDQTQYPDVYRMAFKQPIKFYREHSTREAIEILTREYHKNKYKISADNGNSWTTQWLTDAEAEAESKIYICERI